MGSKWDGLPSKMSKAALRTACLAYAKVGIFVLARRLWQSRNLGYRISWMRWKASRTVSIQLLMASKIVVSKIYLRCIQNSNSFRNYRLVLIRESIHSLVIFGCPFPMDSAPPICCGSAGCGCHGPGGGCGASAAGATGPCAGESHDRGKKGVPWLSSVLPSGYSTMGHGK